MKFKESKITSRWRVTIPESIRKYLRLTPGKKVVLIIKDDHIVIKPKR